jgi:hypothetical protein
MTFIFINVLLPNLHHFFSSFGTHYLFHPRIMRPSTFYSPFFPAHYWESFPNSQPIQRGSTLAIFLTYTFIPLLGITLPTFYSGLPPVTLFGLSDPLFFVWDYAPYVFRSGLCSLNQLFGFLHTVSLPGFTTL